MPDNVLNIIVQTESSELRKLVEQLNRGDLTVKQYQASIRKLRAESIVGSQAQADLGKVIAQVGEQTATANGKMMKSYFQTGEEIRRFQKTMMFGGISAEQQFRNTFKEMRTGDRVMRELTQTAGGLSNMFGAGGVGGAVAQAAGTFQQFEFSAKAIGIATKDASPKIAGMGASIASMAGVVGAVVAVFGLFLLALSKQAEQVEKLEIAHKKLSDALIASGKLNNAQIIREYEKALKGVNKELKELSPSFLEKFGILHDKFLAALSGGLIKLESNLNEFKTKNIELTIEQIEKEKKLKDARIKGTEDAFDALDKYLEINQQVYDAGQKNIAADAKAATEKKKLADEEWTRRWKIHQDYMGWIEEMTFKYKTEYEKIGKMSTQFLSPLEPGGFLRRKITGAKKIEGVSEKPAFEKEISAAQMAANQLADSMSQGFQEATSYLAQGFATAFGLGNSLLDRMIATFATSALMALPGMIANMLTAGATGSIFTALGAMFFQHGGMIAEPVVGIGLQTGRPHVFAERGPEYVSPINSIAQSGRYGGGGGVNIVEALQSINWRIKGLDIVATYDKNQAIRAARLW